LISENSVLFSSLIVVVPAAGVGKRMQAVCPKQYLSFSGKTLLEHTVECLLSHQKIDRVIIALGEQDEYFPTLALATNRQVETVVGGKERVESVLAGLKAIDEKHYSWVLVHDAARPCLSHQDIDKLINYCQQHDVGGLLATPVRDTMKRSKNGQLVTYTEPRAGLWHALTPQMFRVEQLTHAIENALLQGKEITDESSAMELAGFASALIEGRADNIKVTRPDDLALAEFILSRKKVSTSEYLTLNCE